MYPSDRGQQKSEPWTYSRDTLPMTVYSRRAMVKCGRGRNLRPRYRRKKHYFKITDAERIILKLLPDEHENENLWAQTIIDSLRKITITMLEKILFFIPETFVEGIYIYIIELLDKFFEKGGRENSKAKAYAKSLIVRIADKVGLKVTF